MKKIVSLLLALAMALSVSQVLLAQTQANDLTGIYIMDAAGILENDEREELQQKAAMLAERYQVGVYVLTMESYGDYGYNALWELTEAYYNEYALGLGDDRAGVMLTLSMSEREYDILAYGWGNTAFTDHGKDLLEDEFLPSFADDDWAEGFEAYLEACDEFLLAAENGMPIDVTDRKRDKEPALYAAIGLAAGAVVALIVCLVMKSGMKTARFASAAGAYVPQGGIHMRRQQEHFTHTTVIRRPLPQNNDNDGPSIGGTSINAGGFSHRGGKF